MRKKKKTQQVNTVSHGETETQAHLFHHSIADFSLSTSAKNKNLVIFQFLRFWTFRFHWKLLTKPGWWKPQYKSHDKKPVLEKWTVILSYTDIVTGRWLILHITSSLCRAKCPGMLLKVWDGSSLSSGSAKSLERPLQQFPILCVRSLQRKVCTCTPLTPRARVDAVAILPGLVRKKRHVNN